MSKQRPFYVLLTVCLLGLFLLPMSNDKVDANKAEISKEPLVLITEKPKTVIESNKVIAEVQDDAITLPEKSDREAEITNKKEVFEVKSPQALSEMIKNREKSFSNSPMNRNKQGYADFLSGK